MKKPSARREGGFHAIESLSFPRLDRIYNWVFRWIFKEDRGNVLWTAVRYPIPVIFEWRVWRRFRARLQNGEFDVVLRILEIVPEMPSALSFLMRKGPTPFVLGPLNGGVPWPKGFSQLTRRRAAAGNWARKLKGAISISSVQPIYIFMCESNHSRVITHVRRVKRFQANCSMYPERIELGFLKLRTGRFLR